MRKLILILTGLLLIFISCAALFLAGAIYDTGARVSIEPYFFQPDNLSSQRVGRPATPSELGAAVVRDMLIRRFVMEYFYVIPDETDVNNRINAGNNNSLAHLSMQNVFTVWQQNTAPQIQEIAKAGGLRMVRFTNNAATPDIIYDSTTGYWQVFYQLYTWATPNNLMEQPTVSEHTLFLKFDERSGISPVALERGVHEYLDNGGDPVGLFRFKVTDVILK